MAALGAYVEYARDSDRAKLEIIIWPNELTTTAMYSRVHAVAVPTSVLSVMCERIAEHVQRAHTHEMRNKNENKTQRVWWLLGGGGGLKTHHRTRTQQRCLVSEHTALVFSLSLSYTVCFLYVFRVVVVVAVLVYSNKCVFCLWGVLAS